MPDTGCRIQDAINVFGTLINESELNVVAIIFAPQLNAHESNEVWRHLRWKAGAYAPGS